MGFKKLHESFTFADLAMKESLQHNRSLKTLEKVDNAINWSRIESVLLRHYTVGTSGEGADVYPSEFEDHSMRACRCCCVNACSFKNGSGFSRTPNWKTRFTRLNHA